MSNEEKKTSPTKPPCGIKLTWGKDGESGGFKKPEKIWVVIHNNRYSPIPKGSRLWINECEACPNEYFGKGTVALEEELQPFERKRIPITLKIMDRRVDIHRLARSPYVTVDLYSPPTPEGGEGAHLASLKGVCSFLDYRMREYLQSKFPGPGIKHTKKSEDADPTTSSGEMCFKDAAPTSSTGDMCYNIVVMGEVGAGKSSWIQTVATMLSSDDSVVQNLVQVGGRPGHVTMNISDIRLYPGWLRVWDTFGMESLTYKDPQVLRYLVQGGLPNNWSLGDQITDRIRKNILKKQTKKQDERRIHAVVFLVPHSTLDDENMLRVLRDNFAILKEHNLNPIVLLARSDTLCPELRTNAMRWSADIQRELKKCAETFGIPEARVFPCVPYTEERSRNWSIDCLTFQIMEQILRDCNTFLQYGQRNAPRLGSDGKRMEFDSDDQGGDAVYDSDQSSSSSESEDDSPGCSSKKRKGKRTKKKQSKPQETELPELQELFAELRLSHVLQRVALLGVECTADLKYLSEREIEGLEGTNPIQKQRLRAWIKEHFD